MLRHRTLQAASTLSSPSTLQFASASICEKKLPTTSKSCRFPSVFTQRSTRSKSCLADDSSSSRRWKQTLVLATGILLLATPWVRHIRNQGKISSLQDELVQLQQDLRLLQSRLRSQTETHTLVKAASDQQKQQSHVLLEDLRNHGGSYEDFDSEHFADAEKMENACFGRIDELQSEIQRSSELKLAKNGYGISANANRIQVEITLDNEVETFGNKLVIELGPVNLLAHAIELFLMLVEHKHFYDKLILMHRPVERSVIQTIPIDNENMQLDLNNFIPNGRPVVGTLRDSEHVDLTKQGDYMLHQLALLERTEANPVEKYSVLFANHGPHFYINMDDKPNSDLEETCFGKIVEGRAILDFMASHHHNKVRGMFMVAIESVKVLKPAGLDRETTANSSFRIENH